jgi:hypothetical protein
MDQERFDAITRTLASGLSRRGMVRTLGGASLGLTALVGLSQTEARGKPCRSASFPTRCGRGKDSVCTNLNADDDHCGDCDTACPTTAPTCCCGSCLDTSTIPCAIGACGGSPPS